MRLTSFGAAEGVTGSKHLLELRGKRILLDCGLFQGHRRESDRRNRRLGFNADDLHAVVLSHAHIDHSGLLPMLAKLGYRGAVFCTPATRDLCAIMLLDSAHIQERDAQWLSKKELEYVPPLYAAEDVNEIMKRFICVPYELPFQLFPDVQLTFHDAGHVLGSVGVTLRHGEHRVFYTGDVDAHDIAVEANGRVVFISTLLSCVATTSHRFSLEPVWRPPFVSKLAAEDRCHLNGLALQDGRLKYVTACAQTDSFDGWRDQRDSGGCVIDVESGETVVTGLSMPHSPRVHGGRLWVLNSGHGTFGYVDRDAGRFECVAECSGYARGLALIDDWALVGTSLPRHEPTFRGLPLEQKAAESGVPSRCGLQIVSLQRGEVTHWLRIDGDIRELYDVVVLPDVHRPRAAGVLDDEMNHNIWFRDEEGGHRNWTAGARS